MLNTWLPTACNEGKPSNINGPKKGGGWKKKSELNCTDNGHGKHCW